MKSPKRPRVVLDTNLFVSAIIRGGAPFKVLTLWRNDRIKLVITRELFAEITDVLLRPQIREKYQVSVEESSMFIEAIKLNAEFVVPVAEGELPVSSRDEKDNKLLACAFAGPVEYLVTGDQDLLVLEGNAQIGAIKVLSTKEFLQEMGL